MTEDTEYEYIQPAYGVLFPWFVEALGIVVFFLLSRYAPVLPYTGICFIVGALMGMGYSWSGQTDQLTQSIQMWDGIDGEVLLLVFLPGLVCRDAFDLDQHLFRLSFWQCIIFAFPMVLAGTFLTACVAYYIFPYGWSFNFSMTFGAILSATDPAAVSVLLNEVGAPPRLKVHIAGESLLNDGSAIVFYSIFSAMFLYDLGIEGLGVTYNIVEGIKLFFRESLGGVAIGLAFGIGLVLIFYLLDRRLNHKESVVQVSASITVAYLTYYVADLVAETSGVIAVVFCGSFAKVYGNAILNNQELFNAFWTTIEHILNTILFSLGGVVWGSTICNKNGMLKFTAQDWGWLAMLYFLIMVIRFILVFTFYPVTSRIGLKSSWKEAAFMSFAGMRGSVGIALAIALESEVREVTETGDKSQEWTSTLVGMVGGVALFTLMINGTLSGLLLRELGLMESSNARKKIAHSFRQVYDNFVYDNFVELLAEPRFQHVDFALMQHHIPSLHNMTVKSFCAAIDRNKIKVSSEHQDLHTKRVMLQLEEACQENFEEISEAADSNSNGEPPRLLHTHLRAKHVEMAQQELSDTPPIGETDKTLMVELRQIFLQILRSAYEVQLSNGELDGRHGNITYTLLQSIDFSSDAASKGRPLADWMIALNLSRTSSIPASRFFNRILSIRGIDIRKRTAKYDRCRTDVQLALACIGAHAVARVRFSEEFGDDAILSREERILLQESGAQVRLALESLLAIDRRDLETIVSHLACNVLLNKAARYVEALSASRVLKEREAAVYIEEIEASLKSVENCTEKKHSQNKP